MRKASSTVPADARPSRRYKQTRRFGEAAKQLGIVVRELRQEQNFTLEEASARMELDLKHLQKVESGQINVTLVTLLRVADGLNVSLPRLFSRVATKKRKRGSP
jgi:transcriptional regulator with XRE-family HTH domain